MTNRRPLPALRHANRAVADALATALVVGCPAWIRWAAQDADGTWWGYEHEPLQSHRGWYENEVGRCVRLGQGPLAGAWREALVQIDADAGAA